MLGNSALAQLALAQLPQKPPVTGGPSNITETIALTDQFNATVITSHVVESITLIDTYSARQTSTSNIVETIALLDTQNATVVTTGPSNITETLLLVDAYNATLISLLTPDTHDGGFRKKKKKKKKPDDFAEEVDRREKLRKQIVEVIHPPVIEEPEPKHEPEVVEAKGFEIKTDITPPVDYAGLARKEIVEKLKKDAELKARQEFERQKEFERQAELKRLADIEDEDELEMILEALL